MTTYSALYVLLMENFETFANHVQKCMEDCMNARSFKDPYAPSAGGKEFGGVQVFSSMAAVILQ